MPKSQKKDIWTSVDGLLDRLRDLIQSGALVERSHDAVYEELNELFGSAIKEAGFRLTKKALARKIDDVVWTKERVKPLRDLLSRGMNVKSFAESHPFIPMTLIKRKEREYGGVSRAKDVAAFKPGVNRVDMDDEELDPGFELPVSGIYNPIDLGIDVKNGTGLAILNGPNIGTPYPRDIRKNVVRRALVTPEAHGDAALLITGGLLDIDLMQGGKYRAYRALVSGHNPNPDVMDENYRKKAEAILARDDVEDILYETLNERILNSLAGWAKIAMRPDDTPEFSGKIYITFGAKEEEIAHAVAYAEARYKTLYAQDRLDVKRRVIKSALEEARKTWEENSTEANVKEVERLEWELEVVAAERARTIVGNISPEMHKRLYRKAIAWLVKKVEKAIPGSRVIGMGHTYVRVGKDTWKIHQISHMRVTDGVLDAYMKEDAGAEIQAAKMPPVVLLCHMWSPNYRWQVVEHTEEGQRASSQLFVPPCVMNDDEIRGVLKQHIKKSHSLQHREAMAQADTGLLRLVYSDGLWNSEVWPTSALAFEVPKNGKKKASSEPYLWLFINTDVHVGHAWREIVWDPQTRSYFTLGQGVREMMRRSGLLGGRRTPPVHAFFMLDDGIQGHNFDTQKQPHQHHRRYKDVEERSRDLLKENPEAARQFLLRQLWLRGEHWPGEQIAVFLRQELQAQADFYSALLARAEKAKVQVLGVGHYRGEEFDRRDIGLVNFGSGNHLTNTVDREVVEGPLYEEVLFALLSGERRWCKKHDHLRRWVRAPLYGTMSIGWGTIGVEGGYQWPILLRGAPSRKNAHGDTSRREIKNLIRRGDFTRFAAGKKAIHLMGDIHRFGAVCTPHNVLVTSASETDTDPYGELGFTPNNTGVTFVGLPVGGPDAGPLRIVTIRWDFVRDWFRDPFPISWETLLPDAA